MLKGIVSGSPVDITRIAMKGKNLYNGTLERGSINIYGVNADNDTRLRSNYVNAQANTTYFMSYSETRFQFGVRFYKNNGFIDYTPSWLDSGDNFTTPSNCTKIRFLFKFDDVTSVDPDDITKIMLNLGSQALPYEPYGMQSGWEVRDQQGRIIWGADKTLTGTDSITYKGYGLDIKEYDIDGNMVQAAEKEYSITGTSPLDFQSNGSNATISISGNETQASNQAYTTSGTSPLSFNADGTNLTALSMDGNMNQASSQPYTVSGTSPISFMNNGTDIDYTVSGNMNQSGTPTPTSPITPQECGERTGNLLYSSISQNAGSTLSVKQVVGVASFILSKSVSQNDTSATVSVDITLEAGSYTLSVMGLNRFDTAYDRIFIRNDDGTIIAQNCQTNRPITFTLTEATHINRVTFVAAPLSTYSNSEVSIMLNSGSTPLPYEPYGWKIPVTNGSTTYNIYLSEPLRKIGDYADTLSSDGTVMRSVKKFVITGEEGGTWSKNSIILNGDAFFNPNIFTGYNPNKSGYCSHLETVTTTSATQGVFWGGNINFILDFSMGIDTAVKFKAYLREQYAAGTPVTVWYVLSTQQTDTATVPTITPTSGNNTLSVDTTLAPSNITITSNSSVFPGNPITPIECGVKTENLFDKSQTTGIVAGTYINQNGELISDTYYYLSYPIKLTIGETYTWSFSSDTQKHTAPTVGFYDSEDNLLSVVSHSSNIFHFSFTIPQGCAYIRASVYKREAVYTFDPMLISGTVEQADNIPLPWYEPYGYKIPITCGGNTYNIFTKAPLRKIGNYSDSIGSDGVVTRNIKKLVLDGTENWSSYSGVVYLQDIIDYAKIDDIICTCTHYEPQTNVDGVAETTTGHIAFGKSANYRLNIHDANINNAADYKLFLAEQYQNGTPVEVWYVLATPDTTETTTIPTISTVNGSNTLTTQTAITPSNITISTSSSVYPKNPIYPEECGDRTGNLWNEDYTGISGDLKYVPVFVGEGTFTLSTDTPTYSGNAPLFLLSGNVISGASTNVNGVYNGVSRTTDPSNGYITIAFRRQSESANPATHKTMLNTGSTAATYEPYGYKIPVTIGSNTNYIYTKEPIRKIGDYADVVNNDGTVTRRIKKQVLTGQETFTKNSGSATDYLYYAVRGVLLPSSLPKTPILCSHLETVATAPTGGIIGTNTNNNFNVVYVNFGADVMNSQTSGNTVDGLKECLASEYQAGHPVEVWYVLTTPVSDTATFPTVTPASGSNTLSVNTTLAPSAITLTTTSGVWSKNPIEPEEFGDKTANLFDGVWEIGNISASGEMTDINYHVRSSNYTDVSGLSYISATFARTFTSVRICEYDDTKTFLQRSAYETSSVTHQLMQETKYIKLVINDAMAQFPDVTSPDYYTMLVSGQTALPYEPFGYKIPITNSGQTYNVYLTEPLRKIGDYADAVNDDGTVTRRIKKLVLTESGGWKFSSYPYCEFITDYMQVKKNICLCTHLPSSTNVFSGETIQVGTCCFMVENFVFYYKDMSFSDVNEWKSYLAQQYQNGTPVTLWYVLATAQTETVTTPTIATTVGTNILTVDTTLVPSKTTITGHIKPIHFGFKIDKTNSNSDTAVTYTHDAVTMTPAAMNFTTNEFNYGSWENVWFVKDAYPVALNLDGTEAYKLNPNDYTKKDDGTDSDIQFVLLTEAPSDWSTQWKQYYTKDANDNYELNSQSSAPTFTTNTYYKLTYNSLFTGNFMMAFPKVYFKRTEDATYNYVEVSDKKLGDDWYAYAHINTNGQEVDFIYLPLFKGVIVNSKLRSIPGVIPQGNTTATDEVNAATALGSRWHIWDHSSVELINDLLTLMSKSIDSQGRYGQGRSSGYDSTDTVTYGKLQTGTLVKKGKFCGYSVTTKEVKVFGLEGFWANRLDRLQGMMLMNNVWKIKMTPPYNFTGTDFITLSTAEVPSGTGFLSRVQTSEYGSIPASIANGSSTKYFKDPFFKSATNTRVALRGGSCTDGGNAGFRYINVDSAASISYWAVGASPVYK